MELKKGTSLQGGKYKIEKKLGQGSFGITYLATAKLSASGNLGKMDVVAKVCIKEFFMSDINGRKEDGTTIEGSTGSVFTNYRTKFRKEAENLAKLSHSNIVRVFDVFDENGTSYYVMEFLDGENLDDYIRSKGKLSENEAIAIIKEVGDALSYMHSKKMLHLDMKPKNVMHCSDSSSHLIDFGLAKQYTDDGEPESSTTIGLGTPGYAPLEQSQYRQDGTFPATLDVYALGATLFKMLSGKRPPEASILLNEKFPEDDLNSVGISSQTRRAIEKAMSVRKSDRYNSVDAFLNALDINCPDEEKTEVLHTESIESPNNSQTGLNTFGGLISIFKSRNILTNIILILGCLLFLFDLIEIITNCDSYFHNEDNRLFYGELLIIRVSIIFSCLSSCVLLSCNYGNIKFVPLIIFLIYYPFLTFNNFTIFSFEYVRLIAYLIVISSLFLKRNGISAYRMLHKEPKFCIDFNGIKNIWSERNPLVNTILCAGLVSFIYLYCREVIPLDFFFTSCMILCAIGQICLCAGLKRGLNLVWSGGIMYMSWVILWTLKYDYTWYFHSSMLIPILIEQISLLIDKNGKSAWSVMK